jgi:eukaryotic-like serine/threonine-protein kinase
MGLLMPNIKSIAIAICFLLFVGCAPFRGFESRNIEEGGWRNFRNSISEPGVATGKIDPPLRLLWKFKAGGPIDASPIVASGAVFIGSWDRKFHLVDARSGQEMGRYGFSSSITSTACVEGEILYFGTEVEDNRFLAINLKDGKVIWEKKVDDLYSSPLVWEGKIFFGTSSGYVSALNSLSGEVVWQFKTEGKIKSSPIVYDGMLYIGSLDNWFYALDAESGCLKWKYKSEAGIFSSAIAYDTLVYFGSADEYLYALNRNTGDLIWKFKTGAAIYSSPTAEGGFVYFGSNDYCMYALNASSGELIWKFETEGLVHSSPLVIGDKILFGSFDHNCYMLNRSNGELLWGYKTDGMISSSPAYYEGKIYIASRDNYLYCFGK